MNALIEILNHWGELAIPPAGQVLWQSSLLIVVLLALDLLLRNRIRAGFRYALWMLLLVKLVLPPSLALPTGAGYWIKRPDPTYAAVPVAVSIAPPSYEIDFGAITTEPIAFEPVVAGMPSTLAPQAPPPPPAPRLTRDGQLVAWWLGGMVFLLAWMLWRWRWVIRLVRQSEKAPAKLQALLTNVCRTSCPTSNVFPAACRQFPETARTPEGCATEAQPSEPADALRDTHPAEHACPALRLTDTAMSPAVCGLFRPVILLPRKLVNRLTDEQLRTVLLHELIHLRRRDLWVNCVQTLLQIAAWWHPLLWVANARIRRVREEAVDESVACALRDDADAYPATLLEVAKLTFTRPLMTLGLVGILESKNALKQRIRRLLELPPLESTRLKWWQWVAVAALALTALPMAEGQQATDRANDRSVEVPANAESKPTVPSQLETREFRVNPNSFYQSLERISASLPPLTNSSGAVLNGSQAFQSATEADGVTLVHHFIRAYFEKYGVKLEQPKTVFFNVRKGSLLVRATIDELEIVQRAIEALNTEPPQITLEVRTVEVRTEDVAALGNEVPRLTPLTAANRKQVATLSDTELKNATNLAGRRGFELKTLSRVTTLSGYNTELKLRDTPLIVAPKFGPLFDKLEVNPYVLVDRENLQLTIIATIRTRTVDDQGKNSPHAYFVSQNASTAAMKHGETIALAVSAGLDDAEKNDGKIQTLVFITPMIIDPAGNRLGPVGQPSSDQGSASPQSPVGNPTTEAPHQRAAVQANRRLITLRADNLFEYRGVNLTANELATRLVEESKVDPEFSDEAFEFRDAPGGRIELPDHLRRELPEGFRFKFVSTGKPQSIIGLLPITVEARALKLSQKAWRELVALKATAAVTNQPGVFTHDASTLTTWLEKHPEIEQIGPLPRITTIEHRGSATGNGPPGAMPEDGSSGALVRFTPWLDRENTNYIWLKVNAGITWTGAITKDGTSVSAQSKTTEPITMPEGGGVVSAKATGYVNRQVSTEGVKVWDSSWAILGGPAEGQTDGPVFAVAISPTVVTTAYNRAVPGTEERNEALAPTAPATNSSAGQHASQTVKIQNAKLLIELGKLDEAESLLREVAKQDPANNEAVYHLDRLQQLRSATRTILTNPYAERPAQVAADSGRHTIMAKLNRITLDEVRFDRVPLSEVIRELNDEVRRRDSEKKGISFMVVTHLGSSELIADPATVPPVDVAPTDGGDTTDIANAIIDITPPLQNLRVIDALNAIVMAADRGIKFTVEEFAVVFTPATSEPVKLETREFRVDPQAFHQVQLRFGTNLPPARTKPPSSVQSPVTPGGGVRFLTTTNDMSVINAAVIRYIESLGVSLTPPKTLFYNDRNGRLLVRATLEDLEIIQNAVELMNSTSQVQPELRAVEPRDEAQQATPPDNLSSPSPFGNAGPKATNAISTILDDPQFKEVVEALRRSNEGKGRKRESLNPDPAQIQLEVRAIEVSYDDVRELGFDWFVGGTALNGDTANSTNVVTGITGILTDLQFQSVRQALSQRLGIEFGAEHRLVTLSGRQAQMVLTSRLMNGPLQMYLTRPEPMHPILELIPYVGPDGFTIQMTVICTLAELFPTEGVAVFLDPPIQTPDSETGDQPSTAGTPLPRYRMRRVASAVNVWAGQTIVQSCPLHVEVPPPHRAAVPTAGPNETGKRHLLIFITPTIVDAAGNPVRKPRDLPLANELVPPPPTGP